MKQKNVQQGLGEKAKSMQRQEIGQNNVHCTTKQTDLNSNPGFLFKGTLTSDF